MNRSEKEVALFGAAFGWLAAIIVAMTAGIGTSLRVLAVLLCAFAGYFHMTYKRPVSVRGAAKEKR